MLSEVLIGSFKYRSGVIGWQIKLSLLDRQRGEKKHGGVTGQNGCHSPMGKHWEIGETDIRTHTVTHRDFALNCGAWILSEVQSDSHVKSYNFDCTLILFRSLLRTVHVLLQKYFTYGLCAGETRLSSLWYAVNALGEKMTNLYRIQIEQSTK